MGTGIWTGRSRVASLRLGAGAGCLVLSNVLSCVIYSGPEPDPAPPTTLSRVASDPTGCLLLRYIPKRKSKTVNAGLHSLSGIAYYALNRRRYSNGNVDIRMWECTHNVGSRYISSHGSRHASSIHAADRRPRSGQLFRRPLTTFPNLFSSRACSARSGKLLAPRRTCEE